MARRKSDDAENERAVAGHNVAKLNENAKDRMNKAIKAIEKLLDEKAELSAEIADRFKTLKGEGFDVAAIRAIIIERAKKAKDPTRYQELEDMKDLYRVALGMV